jgi:spore germination protein GerM
MEEQKSISKSVVATISALAVAATATGGGIAWFTMQNDRPQTNIPSKITSPSPVTVDPAQVDPPTVSPMPVAPNSTTVTPPVASNPVPSVGENTTKSTTPSVAQNQESTVKIWRLDDDGKKTFLVPQERKDTEASTTNPETRVKRSMSSLIASAGKPDGKLTSTIPVGTKLLSAKVQSDGIHIDLSKEFTQGFGATSMIGRLGQVVYTATAENPDAPVWITVEGKKLEVLGDVGVEIRQPITRQTYNQDFPINPGSSKTP